VKFIERAAMKSDSTHRADCQGLTGLQTNEGREEATRFMNARTHQPDISNNVGPVKSFFEQTSPCTFRSGFVLDDHGPLVI
jgi:hypothetical protein